MPGWALVEEEAFGVSLYEHSVCSEIIVCYSKMHMSEARSPVSTEKTSEMCSGPKALVDESIELVVQNPRPLAAQFQLNGFTSDLNYPVSIPTIACVRKRGNASFEVRLFSFSPFFLGSEVASPPTSRVILIQSLPPKYGHKPFIGRTTCPGELGSLENSICGSDKPN